MTTPKGSSIDVTITMDLSDEDPFAMSDEEERTPQLSTSRNPVEEHLLKIMHETTERGEKARSNVDQVRGVTEKILKKLYVKMTCGESSGSDTDSDLYQATGEPVMKKRRMQRAAQSEPLKITQVWQQIIDDKWIVGIVLKNKSNRVLEDPCVTLNVKDQPEVRGIVTFWIIDDCLSCRTDELVPNNDNKLVATVVLNLPNFEYNDCFEAFGTVSYVLDGKQLQTPVPNIQLSATDVVDKIFAPKFKDTKDNTILAIKSIGVDREFFISLDKEEGRGQRVFEFLEENGFTDVHDDVYVAKNNEFFRQCIFEILPCTENEAPVRVSARSLSHLEVIVRLLLDKFPDINEMEFEFRTTEAAKALERELVLELADDDIGALHEARMVTDLLIA